ncbi:MAG: phosphoribosylamine--glycine ligase [Spirochaetia bacterium]
MKVLILGSGAKAHAMAWALDKSHLITGLYVAPGNSGTAEIAENIDSINPDDPSEVVEMCKKLSIDHCVVGTATAQYSGVVDALETAGINAFGATSKAAQLEQDRLYARSFMQRYKIPTTSVEVFSEFDQFKKYLEAHRGEHLVVKRNRTFSSLNVFDSIDTDRLIDFGRQVLENDTVLVEQFETGYNLTISAFIDGKNHIILPPASDYTKALDNDTGAITNGMGAICPVPILSEKTYAKVLTEIIEPTFEGLKKEGLSYKGVFFFSLLIQEGGAKLTSYHVKLGNPEAQVILPLIKSDFGNLLRAIENGTLDQFHLELSNKSAVGVVIASEGYPEHMPEPVLVQIDSVYPQSNSLLFHGATHKNGDGHVYTKGGRCFTVVGIGDNIVKANTNAYDGIQRVSFPGAWNRKDIGNKFFEE